jgi:hypothetical protein
VVLPFENAFEQRLASPAKLVGVRPDRRDDPGLVVEDDHRRARELSHHDRQHRVDVKLGHPPLHAGSVAGRDGAECSLELEAADSPLKVGPCALVDC